MIHCVLLFCTQTCYHIILYFFHGGEGSRKKRYVTKRGYQIKHYRPLRREQGEGVKMLNFSVTYLMNNPKDLGQPKSQSLKAYAVSTIGSVKKLFGSFLAKSMNNNVDEIYLIFSWRFSNLYYSFYLYNELLHRYFANIFLWFYITCHDSSGISIGWKVSYLEFFPVLIQSKWEKIQTRKTHNMDTFYAV